MKRLISLFVLLTIAPAVFAGATYRFRSVTTGVAAQTLDGVVKTDGGRMRIDLATGDGVLLRNGAVVLSTDGGRTLLVAEPLSRSWYQLDLGDLLGGATGLTRTLGEAVKFDVRNTKASVKHTGRARPIENLPTNRSTIDSSYDLLVNALGQKMTVTVQNRSEVWWTEKLPAEYANVLQLGAVRTGIDAIDRILATQTASLKGFPLKQITTTTMIVNGNRMKSTTTSAISGFRQASFPPSDFVLPPGYAKTASPIEKMMKRLQSRR